MVHTQEATFTRSRILSSDLSLEHDITVSISVKPAEQFERLMNVLPFYQNVVREGIKYAS